MFELLRLLLKLRLGIALLGLVVFWQGWMLIRPKPFPLDPRREAMATTAAENLAESMPQPPLRRPTLVVTPFQGDATGKVTEAVRKAVDRVGRYAVQPTTTMQNVMRELGLAEQSLSPESIASVDLGNLGTDYLLAGRVGVLSATTDKDEAVLEALLVPAGSPSDTVRLCGEAVLDRSVTGIQRAIQSHPWPARLASWLALLLLLPLVLVPLVRRGLARESNAANLGMLLGLTLVTGLAAYAMLGFRLETVHSVISLVGGVGLALTYNWFLLSRLEDLRR